MWSFGVMMYQMLTGHLPFKGMNEFQVFQEITRNAPELPNYLSAPAKDLISKLLV
jgi:serine/threonine protein kinase